MREFFRDLGPHWDVAAVGAVVATCIGWLPSIGALLSVAWLGIRIYNEFMTAVYRARDRRARQPRQ